MQDRPLKQLSEYLQKLDGHKGMTDNQLNAVIDALRKGQNDPAYLSSIAGEGPVYEFENAFAKAGILPGVLSIQGYNCSR